jgi:hypothetical protein
MSLLYSEGNRPRQIRRCIILSVITVVIFSLRGEMIKLSWLAATVLKLLFAGRDCQLVPLDGAVVPVAVVVTFPVLLC